MRRLRAFTLIEMMTVIAITAIILTIIVWPIFQSFNFTRQAQAYVDAQAHARVLVDRIASEIHGAVGIRDNSGTKGSVTVVLPAKPGSANPYVAETLPNTKIDIMAPAQGLPEKDGSGNVVFRDPGTGKIDPTLKGPKGQVVAPVASGLVMTRYWVGLRSPIHYNANASAWQPDFYNEPYSGLLQKTTGNQDNLYVLYRAQVPLKIWDSGTQAFVPNSDLFQTDVDGNLTDIDDPAFFSMLPTTDYDPSTLALTVAGAAKVARIAKWQKVAVIQTEFSRYDMIQPVYNIATRAVTYDGDAPRVSPLIQFRPERISDEPAQGIVAVRQGEETDNPDAIGPDVYRTRLGGLANAVVRLYPDTWDPQVASSQYMAYRPGAAGANAVYGYDAADFPGQTDLEAGPMLFDNFAYEHGESGLVNYPFSQAIDAANTVSSWRSDSVLKAKWTPTFAPFTVLNNDGKITTSFNITEVGSVTAPSADPANQPTVATGASQSPVQDTGAGAVYSPLDTSGTYEINRCFNRVWNDAVYQFLRPDVHRFIDLRAVAQPDGTKSPLDPLDGFPRAQVVPGSETVTGPDQNPGPNYGNPVQYMRVPFNPGPNQYKINYVGQTEPADYVGLGFPANPPAVYDPTNCMSAVIQPRFKAGYLQLNSDPNVPLPNGTFTVTYRFEFSHPRDTVAVDYDSRQVMSVLLTVRNFPQSPVPNPQSVTLKATATVRNLRR